MKRLSISLCIVSLFCLSAGAYGQIAIPAGFPTASTTGLAGVGLTVGDLTASSGRTITVDGTTVDMEDVSGTLTVQANNVTIKRCRISNYSWWAIRVYSGYTGVVVEDCLIPGNNTSVGITGGPVTVRRCDISGDHDGLKITGGSLYEDNYIHDQYKDAGSHNDGMQCSAGSNWTVRGNTIQGPYQASTSAIIIKSDQGTISNGTVEDNFLSGGSYTVYSRDGGYGAPTNISFLYNTWEKDAWLYGRLSTEGTPYYEGNVYHTGEYLPENPPTSNQSPTADAGADQNLTDTDDNGSESASLDGSGSSDSDGTIASYVWTENSSQIATGATPSVSLAVGTHTITLTVTDDDGATDTDTVVIDVAAAPATGTTSQTSWQTFSITAQTGAFTFEFDATPNAANMDAVVGACDGTASAYSDLACIFRFNPSGNMDVRDGSGYAADVTAGYSSGTAYYVRMEIDLASRTYDVFVTPDGGSEIALADDFDFRTDQSSVTELNAWAMVHLSGSVTVDNVVVTSGSANVAPTADAGADQTVTDTDDSGAESVTLDGSGSSDSDGTIASYVWEENSSQIATGASPSVSVAVGSHTITLTVTDDDSATDSDSVSITVSAYVNVAPLADAGSDQTVTDTDDSGAESVTLDGSGSSDSDGTISSYVWEENSSQIATGASPSVSLAVGSHTITLTVTDDDSATDSDTVSITVNAAPTGGATYVVDGNVSDQIVRSDGTTKWVGQVDARIGGGVAGADGAVVYVFELPTLGSGETVTDASLDFTLLGYSHYAPEGNADLYGLPYRSSSAVSTSDFYQGTYGGDSSATAIQDDIMVNTTAAGAIATSTGGQANLASYIAAQYTAGASGGDYVFLRINPDATNVSDYRYWNVATANNATVTNRPVLTVITGSGSSNAAPVADAGADQTVTDTDGNGSASATLDGTGSSDSDGSIASYLWEEDASQIATGSNPSVTLDVGVHTIDLTVTDDDSDTDTDSVEVTVVSPTQTSSTSSTVWPASTLPTQTGEFTVEFDATPAAANIDVVTGLSSGAADWWDELACIVRFNTSGNIDARDGSAYTADATVSYSANTSYHFRMVVDVPNATYSVYVTPSGGSETTVATDYDFRTEQASITSIDNWTLNATGSVGTHTVSNLTITD